MYIVWKAGRKYPYVISILAAGIILLATIALPKNDQESML
jgi:hypothetical protein